jgi:hypothetical protein
MSEEPDAPDAWDNWRKNRKTIASVTLHDGREVEIYWDDVEAWLILSQFGTIPAPLPSTVADDRVARLTWALLGKKRKNVDAVFRLVDALVFCFSNAPRDIQFHDKIELAWTIVWLWPVDYEPKRRYRLRLQRGLKLLGNTFPEMRKFVSRLIGDPPPPEIDGFQYTEHPPMVCRLTARSSFWPVNHPALPTPGTKDPAPDSERNITSPGGGDQASTKSRKSRAAERLARESAVEDYLRTHPYATSKEVREKIDNGIAESTIRKTSAWKSNQNRVSTAKPTARADAMDYVTWRSSSVLLSKPSTDANPGDIAAQREEQAEQDRIRYENEAIDQIEVLRSRYLNGATADEKARFFKMTPADQEAELRAWQWSDDRLPM